jgi:hypothetical protein
MIDGRMITAFLAAAAALMMACSDDEPPGVQTNNGGGSNIPGGVKPGPDMADMTADLADMEADAPLASGEFVPTEPAVLFKYLQDKAYLGLESKNSAVFASDGPHGFQRTYMNSALAEARATNKQLYPAGVAAIKELYKNDKTTLKGWAVQVKVDEDSAAGQGWYWYEILDAQDGSNPDYAGRGVSLCVNCHVSGNDYIRSPNPLE